MCYKKTIEDKLYSYDTKNKVYCKCGQFGIVFYNTHRDRLICKNCGKYIYKDKKTELKYKLLEKGVGYGKVFDKKQKI